VAVTPDAPDISPEILESLELLLYAAIGITSFALADADASELTLPQWRALVVVGREDGIRVGALATRIGTSLPSTSRLVVRLERHGYVTTARDERDRRATIVTLTETGLAVRTRVVERRRELVRGAVAAGARRLPRDLTRGLAVLAEALVPYE
jgi:DNA-binding MarR family transcriptional regulator